MKFVQTVLERIKPEEMGVTLHHEHILWDLSKHNPLQDLAPDDPRRQPITMEILGEMKFHLWEYTDNLFQLDAEVAAQEVQYFKDAGGGTICDNTTFEPRNPVKLQEISRKTGVHILQGTGNYVSYYVPQSREHMDAEQLAQHMITEIRDGIQDTGVRCGFIGELGMDPNIPEISQRLLTAAAIAQKETGAAILIHQPGTEHAVDAVFKVLTDNGADLNKTVMCHCDPLLPDHDYISHIAECGAYISFDFFGLESVLGMSLWLPTDRERILAIRNQIDRGHLNRLLLSHDTAYKCMLRKYGGFGYAHLLRNMVPMMKNMGYEQQWIDQMMRGNPQTLFAMED